MEKNEAIKRREQRKIKSSKKEKTFCIGILKREIFQIQKENNIKNIFTDNYSKGKEVIFYEK